MSTTVQDRLSEPNIQLNIEGQKGQGTSTKLVKSFVKLNHDNVDNWAEFTFANITSTYQHVLRTVFTPCTVMVPTSSECIIGPERSMENVLMMWSKRKFSEAMKLAASVIQQDLRQPLIEPSMRVEGICIQKREQFMESIPKEDQDRPGKYVKPDAYVMGPVEGTKGPIYMPFEIKTSSVWRSSMLKDQKVKGAALQPLRQLGTYCKNCETRIGILLTPIEAVAVRYYDIDEWEVGCHYRAVPWSNRGRQLTVNLAIWACVMMSLNDEYHHIVPKSQLFPEINTWQECSVKGYYQHLYSGRVSSELPIGAAVVPRKAPSGKTADRVVVNYGATDEQILREQKRVTAQQSLPSIHALGASNGEPKKRKADVLELRSRKVARINLLK
ncbi:hypothetical protein F5Y07DRAFT_391588 [Xylaria sp. FL0933]|nr:hypothetical protein F5Y07DRAFT_391588 [Xylaria sp. FL0933]